MSPETWHLAITDGGVVADGVIGQFDTATEAARTASIVLSRVAAHLRTWAASAEPGDPRAGRAREIAGRLLRAAAEICAADTEHAVAEVLDDPNVAAIPLNTLALHHDFRLERASFCDAPIPFSGRWSRQALWLQTWTTTRHDEPDARAGAADKYGHGANVGPCIAQKDERSHPGADWRLLGGKHRNAR